MLYVMSDETTSPAPMLTYRSADSVPAHWTNVSAHRPDPAKFWATYRSNVGLQLVLRVPRLLILLGLFWYFNPYQNMPQIRDLLLMTLAIVIPLSLLLMAVTRYRRERSAFKDLEIFTADQGVLRRGGGVPVLEISREEISRLETRHDGLLVIGHPAARRILVHRCLTDQAGIAARLESWKEIPRRTQTALRRFGMIGFWLLLATLSGLAVWALLFSHDFGLRTVCLVYLAGVSIFAAVSIARTPNATTFQKTMSLISIGIGVLYFMFIYILHLYRLM